MQTVPLSSRIVGQGPPILILHGVFGSGDNWGTFAKPWQDRRTLHLLDLRNHGRSPHADVMDYPSMAADVAAYIDAHDLGAVDMIGHSMGGKAGMYLASCYPEKVKRLAVIDIAPRAYAPHHEKYLAGLAALDLPTLQNRAQAEERMAAYVPDMGTRQFLLKTLVRDEAGRFALRLNLPVLAASILNVGEALLDDARIVCPLLFIAGGNSGYISVRDENDIRNRFPQAQTTIIPDAGHWVQVEQPIALARVLEQFFGI